MTRPLHLAMVTTFYPPYHFGGDAVYLQRLCWELAERGHRVDVIHNPDAYRLLGGSEPTRPGHSHPNITIHPLTSRSPLFANLVMQQTGTPGPFSRQLASLLERNLDVIHFHNVSLAGGPTVLTYGSACKLYTTHEYWLVCPTHVLFRMNREACTRRTCLACQLAYRRPPQLWRYGGLLERCAREVDLFLAPSQFAAAAHRERGLDVPMVQLNHPGPQPAPPAERNSHSPPYFLYVGRLEYLKGVHTLLPLFQRRRELQLWIVGTGTQEPELRRLIGSSSNVRLLGWTDHRELEGLYRNAIALLVPSLCYEVQSLVPLEAFQQATPVIARDIGALSEVIAASGGGLLYRTEQELEEAIGRLHADPALREELGQKGQQAYLAYWTPEAHLSRYLQLVDQLLASRSGPTAHAAASPATSLGSTGDTP